MTRRLLLIGIDGLLGRHLAEKSRHTGWDIAGTSRRIDSLCPHVTHLDLADAPDHWQIPSECQAAVILAGVHKFDDCRANPAATRFINVTQTLILAKRLVASGVFVIFPSTSFVFDGTRPARRPEEPVSPQCEYGRQKAEVESELLAHRSQTAIIRLGKVFHSGMPLLQRWRESLEKGESIPAFYDLFCSPTPLEPILEGLSRIAMEHVPGIWHFSPPDDVSYLHIAERLAEHCGAEAHRVIPVSCADTIPPEHRPRFTSLDSSRTCERLKLTLPTAPEAIDEVISTQDERL